MFDAASLSDWCDFLAETQIFQGLPQPQLIEIGSLARLQVYDKGAALFHQGDESHGFYIVRLGRVKVFQLSSSGREQILHVFGTGDHFAEVPAFDGQAFPASAAALEKTSVLFFQRQLFLERLAQNPALTLNLLKSFARHLRRFSHLVDDLSLREVPGRLAAYLLKLSAQADNSNLVKLDLSKRQLASLLGTIPETLSRVLYRLSCDGLILVEGTQITLLDRDRLRQIAQ
ncbi:MAG: Crp/Fnr family transcriptional regulator [Almyronema sp.]